MKTKQLLSLFLAAAMVLALCACGAGPAAPGAMASEAPEPSQSAQTEEMMITDMIGREICTLLYAHRLRMRTAVVQYVEPQIEAMLAELSLTLDAPFFDPGEGNTPLT